MSDTADAPDKCVKISSMWNILTQLLQLLGKCNVNMRFKLCQLKQGILEIHFDFTHEFILFYIFPLFR